MSFDFANITALPKSEFLKFSEPHSQETKASIPAPCPELPSMLAPKTGEAMTGSGLLKLYLDFETFLLGSSASQSLSHQNKLNHEQTENQHNSELKELMRGLLRFQFGDNLGELLANGLETLTREPVLHQDFDPEMPCNVFKDRLGEIEVHCESKVDPKNLTPPVAEQKSESPERKVPYPPRPRKK